MCFIQCLQSILFFNNHVFQYNIYWFSVLISKMRIGNHLNLLEITSHLQLTSVLDFLCLGWKILPPKQTAHILQNWRVVVSADFNRFMGLLFSFGQQVMGVSFRMFYFLAIKRRLEVLTNCLFLALDPGEIWGHEQKMSSVTTMKLRGCQVDCWGGMDISALGIYVLKL